MPMTNAGAQRCLQSGLISAAMYAGLHTGTPPASGNELSASGYDALHLAVRLMDRRQRDGDAEHDRGMG